jgi:hypothetical protein
MEPRVRRLHRRPEPLTDLVPCDAFDLPGAVHLLRSDEFERITGPRAAPSSVAGRRDRDSGRAAHRACGRCRPARHGRRASSRRRSRWGWADAPAVEPYRTAYDTAQVQREYPEASQGFDGVFEVRGNPIRASVTCRSSRMIRPGAQAAARRAHRLALAEAGRARAVDEKALGSGGVEQACADDLAEPEGRPVERQVPGVVRRGRPRWRPAPGPRRCRQRSAGGDAAPPECGRSRSSGAPSERRHGGGCSRKGPQGALTGIVHVPDLVLAGSSPRAGRGARALPDRPPYSGEVPSQASGQYTKHHVTSTARRS